jgi:hypothetical protein
MQHDKCIVQTIVFLDHECDLLLVLNG